MFLCFLGEKYGEKRGKRNVYKDPQTAPKTSPLQSELLVAFYRPCMLFEARLTSAILSICTFLVLTLDIHLQVFSDSDWDDLSVPGKLWMSNFQKTKEIKIPTVGSKVMTLGSILMRFSQFSQFLNCFNFNFDPWIVVGMRIWLSSQWHWSQPILVTGSRLGFLGPTKSQLQVKRGQSC